MQNNKVWTESLTESQLELQRVKIYLNFGADSKAKKREPEMEEETQDHPSEGLRSNRH
jgi:hypothetical protein